MFSSVTGIYSEYENPPEIQIVSLNIPKFLKIGEPFDFDVQVDVKNQSNGTNSLKGSIDYFVSDRNNKIAIEGSSLINSSLINQSNSKKSSW